MTEISNPSPLLSCVVQDADRAGAAGEVVRHAGGPYFFLTIWIFMMGEWFFDGFCNMCFNDEYVFQTVFCFFVGSGTTPILEGCLRRGCIYRSPEISPLWAGGLHTGPSVATANLCHLAFARCDKSTQQSERFRIHHSMFFCSLVSYLLMLWIVPLKFILVHFDTFALLPGMHMICRYLRWIANCLN